MSTETLEAPDTSTRSVAEAPKTGKETGLVSMSEKIAQMTKPEKVDTKVLETEKIDPNLLRQIEPTKEKAVEKKTTKEDDIRALKTARSEAEKERDALRTELDTIKTKYVPPERLTAAEQRAAELEAKLEIQSLADSPKFNQEFTQPKLDLLNQASELAKDVLGADGEGLVERALNLKGAARREFLDSAFANSSPSALGELTGLLANIETLERKKAAKLQDWKQERERMSAEERASQLRDAEDGRNEILRAFDANKSKVAAKIPGYREIVGDEEHNQTVALKMSEARKLLTGEASMEDQAIAAYLAIETKYALKEIAQLRSENEEMAQRLAKYESNKPNLNGSSSDNGNSDGRAMGMVERIKTMGR